MLEIGRITRSHGVRGEVAVLLTSNRTERLATGSVFSTANGPLAVSSARRHKGGWLVWFDGVASREAADELRNVILLGEPIDDPDELWVHELIGSVVVDQDGVGRGTVTQLIENPASDLLELDSGALVPLRFVINHKPGETIEVDAPDGLFDLDDR